MKSHPEKSGSITLLRSAKIQLQTAIINPSDNVESCFSGANCQNEIRLPCLTLQRIRGKWRTCWCLRLGASKNMPELDNRKPSDLLAPPDLYDKNSRAALYEDGTHGHVLRSLFSAFRSSMVLGGDWFCGRCKHVYDWREGSRILSLRHGLEPNEVALYRAFPMPKGEVETFFATMRLATNISDNNLSLGEEENSRGSFLVTCSLLSLLQNTIFSMNTSRISNQTRFQRSAS